MIIIQPGEIWNRHAASELELEYQLVQIQWADGRIRFPGLARSSHGTGGSVIKNLTGYTVLRDGDDWIVRGDDPELTKGPSPLLHTQPKPLPLASDKYAEISQDYAENYRTEYESWRDQLPQPKIEWDDRYGFKSQLVRHRDLFFFTKHPQLAKVLREQVLPFMHKTAGARSVIPLKINTTKQYGIIALAKISYLTKRFGFEKAIDLIQKKRALTYVLPSDIDVLSYIEGLLTFTPFAVTLSLERMASQLHFFSDNVWHFPVEANKGIYELPNIRQSPIVELGRILFVRLTGSSAPAYFQLAVRAINNLMRYLNNPLNFTDSTGQFDEHVFLKVQSAVHLMFADLAAINYTNSAHLQVKASFSFVNKLANLKAHLAGKPAEEDRIFQTLFSSKMCSTIAKIVGFHGRQQYQQLGPAMRRASERVYSRIHTHLARNLPTTDKEEDERLQRLRTFRNLSHGTFLRRQAFEATFVESAATIPFEVTYVPLLLSWGLCLEPKQILDF